MKILEVNEIIGCALMVIGGSYGNGEERKSKLKEEGLDPDTVQACVNDLLVLLNKYGG